MAEINTPIEQRVSDLATRVAQEIKTVRGEIVAGGQVTTADKVKLADGTSVQEQIDNILYKKVEITAFSNSVNVVELGSTVDNVTLTWTINKTPTSLALDGEQLDVSLKTKALTGLGLKANKTWNLTATDARNATSTKSTTLQFLNGRYFGTGAVNADGVTDTFVQGLSKALVGSRACDFTVNAAEGQYIYFAIPARFGTPSFFVGGFEGGFTLLKTFDYTNQSGYKESYTVYKSDNAGLGSTKVTVK